MIVFDKVLESAVEDYVNRYRSAGAKSSTAFLIGSTLNGDYHIAHLSTELISSSLAEDDNEAKERFDEHGCLIRRFLPGGTDVIGMLWICSDIIAVETRIMLHKHYTKILKESAENYLAFNSNNYCVVCLNGPKYKPQGYIYEVSMWSTEPSAAKVSFSELEWIGVESSAFIRYSLPLRYDVCNFRDQFRYVMSKWSEELNECGVTLINGRFKSMNDPAKSKDKRNRSNAKYDSICVDLFLSADNQLNNDAKSLSPYRMIELKADLIIKAAVPSKADIHCAVNAVKQHILRNLALRAILHYETMEVTECVDIDSVLLHRFPRMVTAQLRSQPAILFSDCLMLEDTKQVAKDDFKQYLSLDCDNDEINDGYERPDSDENLYSILERGDRQKRPSSSASSHVSLLSSPSTYFTSQANYILLISALVAMFAIVIYLLISYLPD